MIVDMTKKIKAPDAWFEGSDTRNVLVAMEKQSRTHRAFHTRVTRLFRTMACGVDKLEARLEKRLDRLEEKLDSLVGEK
jgi:hypothetical protein